MSMSLIERLKGRGESFAGLRVEFLVELLAYAGILVNTYASLSIPIPEWLIRAKVRLRAQIQTRYQVEKEERRAALRDQIAELRSREERRADLEKELAELEGSTAAAHKELE